MNPIQASLAVRGIRRYGLLFFCGALSTLALAPFFLFPLLIIGLLPLYWRLNATPNVRAAMVDGWWWFFGYHVVGLYWMCLSLLVEPEKFAWLIPFTLFGLTGVIALYGAFAGALVYALKCPPALKPWRFALVLCAVEWVRGHALSGFPWNLFGYAFSFSLPSLQLASLVGVYGLTFFTLVLSASVADGLERRRARMALMVWGIFALGCAWGALRVEEHPTRYRDDVHLRLIQANIQQHHKWDPRTQQRGMEAHLRLMQMQGADQVTHFIWPETAIPYVVQPNSALTRLLAQALKPRQHLLSGSLRSEERQGQQKIWNSIVAISSTSDIVGVYDKVHLVPFGEFIPLRSFLPQASFLVGGMDFSRGQNEEVMRMSGLPPLRPLICYEAIFPGGEAGEWLLNVTNDAWFGNSTGPRQHFEMSRMRAVEQGVPLVRAANTGISAIVDPMGRVLQKLSLGDTGVIDSRLPLPAETATFYSEINRFIAKLPVN